MITDDIMVVKRFCVLDNEHVRCSFKTLDDAIKYLRSYNLNRQHIVETYLTIPAKKYDVRYDGRYIAEFSLDDNKTNMMTNGVSW